MADNGDDLPADLLAEEILIALAANDELDLQAEEALEAALGRRLELERVIQESIEYLAGCIWDLGVTLAVGLVVWVILTVELAGGLNLDDEAAVISIINRIIGH